MNKHDEVRMERALAHKEATFKSKEAELESLSDAIRGLQSTDDPSLVPLHDELMDRYLKLEKELEELKK